jgi:hypothetical protein
LPQVTDVELFIATVLKYVTYLVFKEHELSARKIKKDKPVLFLFSGALTCPNLIPTMPDD